MVLPIFDGGNVGIRRRHMQELMLDANYDAWASTYGPSGQSATDGSAGAEETPTLAESVAEGTTLAVHGGKV